MGRILIVKAYEDGHAKELSILVSNGIVVKRYNYVDKEHTCKDYECVDLRDKGLLLPGFIDIHVHLRGLKLSHKEDEESGTKAAASGGFTAVVDMPNTEPAIDNPDALNMKLEMLKSRSYVDYGLYVAPSDEETLRWMLARDGVVGIKLFPRDLYTASTAIRIISDAKKILIIHAENPSIVGDCEAGLRWVCRPIESEVSVLNLIYDGVQQLEKNARVHITHVTNTLTLMVAKRYGFSTDTCPHYLYLDSEYEKGMGCLAKVNPPLRTRLTKELLLKSLKMFDAISSDHAPHTAEEKSRDFATCPSGIASLEISAPLMLNLFNIGVLSMDDIVRLLSKGPAKILGLYRWGCLYEGCIASYTVVDMDKEVEVEPELFFSKAKASPYRHLKLKGSVRATIVRGHVVYLEGSMNERITPRPLTDFMRV